MWKALVYKELRETWAIAALGLLGYLWSFSGHEVSAIGLFRWSSSDEIPFVGEGFVRGFVAISLMWMIALGLRQTVGESVRGTWLFLLNRPLERGTLIGLKLATGLALCLICAVVPVLWYARWAATPGTHASPFEWSMTLRAWQAWLTMPGVYLAAFLTGLRPGRWIGSRLTPLAGAGLLLILLQALPWWWLLGLTAVVLLDAWLIWDILYVAQTRDY